MCKEGMKLTILFGTETGNSEELAETLAAHAVSLSSVGECCVTPADDVPIDRWASLSPLVIICSTAGQGEAPRTFRSTWMSLRMPDAPCMSGLKFAVFGLGDSNYPKYNYLAKMLHNRLRQLGAEPIVHRGLGDEEDKRGVLQAFVPWVDQLWKALELDTDNAPPLLSAPPRKKFEMRHSSEVNSDTQWHPHHPCDIRSLAVRSNLRLTSEDHFQDVHHIVLDRPKDWKEFSVGASLAVFPPNEASRVHRLLEHCGLPPDQIVEIGDVACNAVRTIKAFDAINTGFDCSAAASRLFFQSAAYFTDNEEERERLTEISSLAGYDDFLNYSYREKRPVDEVLAEFPSCRIPFDVMLSLLKPLRPRYFSLSSPPTSEGVTELSITVARLQFTTPYKRCRRGLCSDYLCSVQPGAHVRAALDQPFHSLPLDRVDRPLILVGPGTGIAPIRCLVREVHGVWRAPIHVFIGCRHPDKDWLYADEWKELAAQHPHIHIHTAFSRLESQPKTYVQHVIVQPGVALSLVRECLAKDPLCFICGNSKQMPRDVERALMAVVRDGLCGGDEAAAMAWLKDTRADGRFLMDTWS